MSKKRHKLLSVKLIRERIDDGHIDKALALFNKFHQNLEQCSTIPVEHLIEILTKRPLKPANVRMFLGDLIKDWQERGLLKNDTKLPDCDLRLFIEHSNSLITQKQYVAARNLTEQTLRICPDCVVILKNHAFALLRLGEYEAAIESYREILRNTPDDVNSLFNCAKALVKDEQYTSAFEMYRQALQIAPEDLYILREYAADLSNAGHYADALEVFHQILDVEPEETTTLMNHGITLMKLKRYDDAIIALKKSVVLSPKDPEILYNYGYILAESGQYEKAIEIYQQALQLSDRNSRIMVGYGYALRQTKNSDKAIELYKQALQIEPNDISILLAYAQTLYERSQYDMALRKYEEAEKIAPDDPEVLIGYGTFLGRVGEYNLAIEKFKRVLRNEPEHLTALTFYATSLSFIGNSDAAIAQFEKILQINSTEITALINYGELLDRLGKHKLAIKQYEKVLQLDDIPTAYVLSNYGAVLAHQNKHQEAIEKYKQALQLDPVKDAFLLNNWGVSLIGLGQYAAAIEKFRNALNIQSNHPSILTNYGLALVQIGQLSEASAIFKKALALAPHYSKLLLLNAYALEKSGHIAEAIAMLKNAEFQHPLKYKEHIFLQLGRLCFLDGQDAEGRKYFTQIVDNLSNKRLANAINLFLAVRENQGTHSSKLLQQIAEDSVNYSKALEILALNQVRRRYERHAFSLPLPYPELREMELSQVYHYQQLKKHHEASAILVEGPTDKQILEIAINLFSTSLDTVEILTEESDSGGTNWVKKKILAWVYNEKKEKRVALLDRDGDGRATKKLLEEKEEYCAAQRNRIVRTFLLKKPAHLITDFKKVKGLLSEFPFCIEEMFPLKYWELAQQKGWLEKRKNPVYFVPEFTGEQTLEEYLSSKGVHSENFIYILYQFKWEYKKKFARYVCNLPHDEQREAFMNFKNLINDIESFWAQPIIQNTHSTRD